MIYLVYKSLDNPASFFGIKGSYIYYVIVGALISGGLGVIVGMATIGFLGFIVFVIGSGAAYLGTMIIQARYTERERKRWISSRKIPDVVSVPPRTMKNLADKNLNEAQRREGYPQNKVEK